MSTSPIPGSHSQASLSQRASPTSPTDEISLDTLVTHLLASKRSLSSISTVWRANEIVTSARSALEESAVLRSRTGFLRKGISQQAAAIERIRKSIEVVYLEGQAEFKDVIHNLDAANGRLQETMDILRATIVEAAFRPPDEQPRSLLDFVDEGSVETMRASLKDSIDQARELQEDFISALQSCEDDLKAVMSALPSLQDPTSSISSVKGRPYPSPIPELLHSLEFNASEMANLLDSLVSHFDLCVNAIKHTEGGFAAVRDVTSANPNLPSLSGVLGSPMNSTNLQEEIQPQSEQDRRDMFTVLATDAAEVDDVVLELQQRLASMETQYEQICDYLSSLRASYNATLTAFQLLESIGTNLPTYISSSRSFIGRWADLRAQLEAQMDDLEAMRVFYEGYLGCYDGLILEVARRKAAEEKVKHVLRKAMEQVKRIHDTDTRERESFRREVGDFLPSDLWPGLVADAPKLEIGVVGDGEKSTPQLDKVVVEAAFKRERERPTTD